MLNHISNKTRNLEDKVGHSVQVVLVPGGGGTLALSSPSGMAMIYPLRHLLALEDFKTVKLCG